MRKSDFSLSVIVIFLLYLVLSSACGFDEQKNDTIDSTASTQIRNFSVSDYNFSILEGSKFIKYNKGIYQRGDEVYMVLEDVGPFARGRDSLNHAEMKLEVVDAIGQNITTRESLFGARGHGNFTNDLLNSPYASYSSDLKDKPGKYTMSVTIYDIVRKDSIVVIDDFFLE